MSSFVLLLAAGLFAVAFLLWDRWRTEELATPPLPDEARDADRIWDADGAGVRALTVLHREVHDPYRTVGELLDALAELRDAAGAEERYLKALYQLEGTLGVTPKALQGALAGLVGTTVMGKKIARVASVQAGALVERRTMRPLGPGSRVRQALGPVAYAEDGTVLLKAKVVT